MVKEQLIKRGITNERVLTAMGSIPRHLFVDEAFHPRAYGDHPLPIGNDQTISQPYIVALMSQELDPPEGAKVLEIGTGSGYQGTVLAMMGCEVYTIERIPELSMRAKDITTRLGITGLHFNIGDGTRGWIEEAPYDRIVVTAGAPALPEDLAGQLTVGGRMIIPVGERAGQRLLVIEKGDDVIEKRDVCDCTFVPLIGKQGWEGIE